MFANAQKDHSILLARIKNNVKGNKRKQLVLRVTCVAYGKVVLASSTSWPQFFVYLRFLLNGFQTFPRASKDKDMAAMVVVQTKGSKVNFC